MSGSLVCSDPDTVAGVRLLHLPAFADERGLLAVAEHPGHMPFVPKRLFSVYGVPSTEIRGEHAHRACEQLLICVHGSIEVIVDDGSRQATVILDRPALGLRIGAMVWATQHRFTQDAVLVVLASMAYDADDYIRDFQRFLKEVAAP